MSTTLFPALLTPTLYMPLSNLISFDRIKQKTIRAYIREKDLRSSSDFDKLNATEYNPSEPDSYLTHCKTFEVETDLPTVWKTYLSIAPRDTWKSKMVSFGCMYSRQSKSLSYMEDAYDGLQEGQVLFLNIRLFGGMVNIAVAHKIIRVNEEHKYIEFSYIEGGKTQGSQRLTFVETANKTTRIIHKTTYKGQGRATFREKILYPFLHGRVIAAFHANVKHKIREGLATKKESLN